MTTTADTLLARIERHCRDTGTSETAFGIRAANNGAVVGRLRKGRSITLRTLAKIETELARGSSSSPVPSHEGAAA